MQRDDYTAANQLAWNQAVPIHKRLKFAQLIESFRQPSYSCLDAVETSKLREIGLGNKSVAPIGCNNGRELLSVKNLGASRCVGFDMSDGFIDQARQLAQASQIKCEFVCTDAYNISSEYNQYFDLVYIAVGVLSWMPDISQFFAIVARLLKPSGQLFIYELHPVLEMFEPSGRDDPPRAHNSYFKTDPYIEEDGLDYYGRRKYTSAPFYSFPHKLSDVMTAILTNSLQLLSFEEYGHDISNLWAHFEHFKVKPPLC